MTSLFRVRYFLINMLMAYRCALDKVIIWHELVKYNAILKQIPSEIWYGFIARFFTRNAKIIACSIEARNFIKQYCKNVEENVIDYGVNLDKFQAAIEKKDKYLIFCGLFSTD